MGDVVNLNRFRKAKAKLEAASRAQANRARHGRTKAEKEAERRAAEKAERDLNGAELEDD